MGILDDAISQAKKWSSDISDTASDLVRSAKQGNMGAEIGRKLEGGIRKLGSSIDTSTPSGRQTRDLAIDRVLHPEYDAEAGRQKIRNKIRSVTRKLTR